MDSVAPKYACDRPRLRKPSSTAKSIRTLKGGILLWNEGDSIRQTHGIHDMAYDQPIGYMTWRTTTQTLLREKRSFFRIRDGLPFWEQALDHLRLGTWGRQLIGHMDLMRKLGASTSLYLHLDTSLFSSLYLSFPCFNLYFSLYIHLYISTTLNLSYL